MPKSLKHYVEDRHQLLDQVFTILSESDVRGMLPDILKASLSSLRDLSVHPSDFGLMTP